MITTFIIGEPSKSPRMIFTGNEEVARLNTKAGEVCFVQVNYPAVPHVINSDGTKLVADKIDPETLWRQIRADRNNLLDRFRWTIAPDSELSEECLAEWLAYLKALNRITVDFDDPAKVVWPVEPEQVYPAK